MLKTILTLLLATSLFASSTEDREIGIEYLKQLWEQKDMKADEKKWDINVPIEKEDIIWIPELETIPKGWYAGLTVHWEDLMIVNPNMPDIKYDFLDKKQNKINLKMVVRKSDGYGIPVGANANMAVYRGPVGVRIVGGKDIGITGVIRCRIVLRRCWVPPTEKK